VEASLPVSMIEATTLLISCWISSSWITRAPDTELVLCRSDLFSVSIETSRYFLARAFRLGGIVS